MSRAKTCRYDFIEIGFQGNLWRSQCHHDVTLFAPRNAGVAQPPLPTNDGAKFCTFCGKPIKVLKNAKPQREPKIPVAPPPEPKERIEETPFQPTKAPPLFGSRPKTLEIDNDHNSYEGWQQLGLQVQRGEKSVGRNADGINLFHRNSVKPPEARKPFQPRQPSSQSTRGDEPWPPPNYDGHLHEFHDDDIPY